MNVEDEEVHTPRILPGARLNAMYEMERLLAVGGMGVVYAGVAVETGIPVAIKMIRPELAADPVISGLFRREATALHRLRHDSIVGYYVFSVDPALNATYLAMEFVPGRSLSDVAAERPLDLRSVRVLQKRLASGLQAAHEAGIVHRDISADNIILPNSDPARAKIIDFGIARNVGDGQTIIGSRFAGKNNYSSPEQFGLFGGVVTDKSDVYSLGLVLAETMVGHPLDMRGSMAEVVEKRERVPDLSEIDDRMQPLLERMLQPNPADRPSMAEVAAWDMVREPTSSLPVAPTPAPARIQPVTVRSRVPLIAAGAAGAFAVLALLAFLFWPGARREPPVAAMERTKAQTVAAQPAMPPSPALPPIAGPLPAPSPAVAAPPPVTPVVEPQPAAIPSLQPAPQPSLPVNAGDAVPPTAPQPDPQVASAPAAADCRACADLVPISEGRMAMGSARDASERPIHDVAIQPFLIGRSPVTVGDWKACVRAGACGYEPKGDDNEPVFNVSYDDVQQYLAWITRLTGRSYRLPSEAEWEFAARAGSRTAYWWGDQFDEAMAGCHKCGPARSEPLPVGRYQANALGLYDMLGSIGQWVSDCWHKDYRGAPKDSAPWDSKGCRERVLRGGSWMSEPANLTVTSRDFYDVSVRYPSHGFRIARDP